MEQKVEFLKIISTLKKIKRLKEDYEVANLLGMGQKAFSARKRRGSVPWKRIIDFCEREKIPFKEVIQMGEQPGFKVLQPFVHAPPDFQNFAEARVDHYRAIPLCEDGRLSAGNGGLAFSENHLPDSMVWVYEPEIGRATHRLQAVRVGGDSMEPTVPSGSIVVFDLDDKEFIDRQIYVIRKPEAGLDIAAIKRMRKGEKGFVLISDNPRELPELVEGKDWNELVVGKAIWMWRSLLGP